MNAYEAFQTWLWTVGAAAGGACILVIVACSAVAVTLMARSKEKRDF